ncbi:MAG: SHOCT domain-containing protein [Phycisphaeraceae bacterium]
MVVPTVPMMLAFNSGDMIRSFAIMAVCLIMLGVILAVLRVYVARRGRRGGSRLPSGGFTLRELRLMHERGELTDEEYEAMRGRIMGAAADGGVEGSGKADSGRGAER